MKKKIALVLAVIMVWSCVIIPISAEETGAEIIASADMYLTFDDESIADKTGNHSLTMANKYQGVPDPSFVNEGKFGEAIETSKDSFLVVYDLEFGVDSYTITTWTNILYYDGGDPVLFGNKDWNDGSSRGMIVWYEDTFIGANLAADGDDRYDIESAVDSEKIQSEWVHIALVVNKTENTSTLYIDGEPTSIDIPNLEGKVLDCYHPFVIGNDGTYSYGANDGLIANFDDFAVFKSALSEDDVAGIYNYEFSGDESSEEFIIPEVYENADMYLPFENGSIEDVTGHYEVKTANKYYGESDPISIEDGKNGEAVELSKDAFLVVEGLEFGVESYSITTWTRIVNYGGGDPVLFGNKDWNDGTSRGMIVYYDETAIGANLAGDGEDRYDDKVSVESEKIQNNWVHIALVVDKTENTSTLYVNGEPKKIEIPNLEGKALDSEFLFTIGNDASYMYGSNEEFVANFDDFAVFKTALTENDIADIYNYKFSGDLAEGFEIPEVYKNADMYLPFEYGSIEDAMGRYNVVAASSKLGVPDPIYIEEGKFGKSIETSKDSFLVVEDLEFGADSYTLAAWTRIANYDGGDPVLFGNKDWITGNNQGVLVYYNDIAIGASLTAGGDRFDNNFDVDPFAVQGEWVHIAVVVDRENDISTIYIDGVPREIKTPFPKDGVMDTEYPFAIGTDGTFTYGANDGLVTQFDEFVFIKRALTDDEVAALYSYVPTIEVPDEPIVEVDIPEVYADADMYLPFEGSIRDAKGKYNLTTSDESWGTPGAMFVEEGKFGKSIETSSDSFLVVEDLEFGADSYTITTWAKIDTYIVNDPALFGNKDWSSGGNQGFVVFYNDGTLCLDTNINKNRIKHYFSNESVDMTEQWVHLAIVVDRKSGVQTVYYNGIPVYADIITLGDGVMDSEHPFVIGNDGTRTYNGDNLIMNYDDFAFFKKALTIEEVHAIYEYAPEGYEGAIAPEVEIPDYSIPPEFDSDPYKVANSADVYLSFDGELEEGVKHYAGSSQSYYYRDELGTHPDARDLTEADPTYVDGLFGQALHTDSKVTTEVTFDISDGTSYTLASWIKLNEINGEVALFNYMINGGQQHGTILNVTNTGVSARIGGWLDAGYTSTDITAPYLNSPITNRFDTWNHVVLTVDRETKLMKIYFNGRVVAVTEYDAAMDEKQACFDGGYMTVILNNDHQQSYMFGNKTADLDYDELAFFKRALSEDEVAALYSYDPTIELPEEPIIDIPEVFEKADMYLPFENGSVADAKGNYNVTIVSDGSDAVFVENGIIGSSIETSFSNFLKIEDLEFGADSYTITAWTKIANYEGDDPVLFGNKDWDSFENPGMLLAYNGESYRLTSAPEGVGGIYHDREVDPTDIEGEWIHIAIVVSRESNIEVFYINGVPSVVKTYDWEDYVMDSEYPFIIGNDGTGMYWANEGFVTQFDDFAFFKSALSLEEVQDIFTYASPDVEDQNRPITWITEQNYECGEDEVMIIGLDAPSDVHIGVLPAEIDGMNVIGISSEFDLGITPNHRFGDEDGHLVIPEGYRKLWFDVFNGCSQIKSVSLPETLDEIDVGAFRGTSISSIVIPANTDRVLSEAFRDCYNLEEVYILSKSDDFNENSIEWPYNDVLPTDENGDQIATVYLYEGTSAHYVAEQSGWNYEFIEEEPEVKTYTITYNTNGGENAPEPQTKNEGETIYITEEEPVLDGYIFLGWSEDPYAEEPDEAYNPGSAYEADEDITLYAVWKSEHTVSVIIGDASGRPGDTIEVTVSLENNPGIAAFQAEIAYPADVLTLESVTSGDSFANDSLTPNLNLNPVVIVWYDVDKTVDADDVFITLTFKINDNATDGEYEITINNIELGTDTETFASESESGTVEVYTYILGDVTGDGAINMLDLVRLQKYVNRYDVQVDETASDVTGDGKINVLDILRIGRYLAGYDVEFVGSK
ncbi:MAG: hypothetical protein E7672_03515 [Ruminococcaceae bacterium]|nr:hypothetical protein [Oscillospiraceae bacterium]